MVNLAESTLRREKICFKISALLDSVTFYQSSFQQVNPRIKIPPTICHILMASPKTVTEITTATSGARLLFSSLVLTTSQKFIL